MGENDVLVRFWCGNECLKDAFPNLYHLEKKKKCKVNEHIRPNVTHWEWKSMMKSTELVREMSVMTERHGDFQPTPGPNTWCCEFLDSDRYHVSSLRRILDVSIQTTNDIVMKWTHDTRI